MDRPRSDRWYRWWQDHDGQWWWQDRDDDWYDATWHLESSQGWQGEEAEAETSPLDAPGEVTAERMAESLLAGESSGAPCASAAVEGSASAVLGRGPPRAPHPHHFERYRDGLEAAERRSCESQLEAAEYRLWCQREAFDWFERLGFSATGIHLHEWST